MKKRNQVYLAVKLFFLYIDYIHCYIRGRMDRSLCSFGGVFLLRYIGMTCTLRL